MGDEPRATLGPLTKAELDALGHALMAGLMVLDAQPDAEPEVQAVRAARRDLYHALAMRVAHARWLAEHGN